MGFFITFEGIEGCGKTTQFNMLNGYLKQKRRKSISLREPGGTDLGERVRAILLNSGDEEITPLAELFLYEACRAQLVENIIKPALKKGNIVVCDRFFDSTVAYQGFGRGLDKKLVANINSYAAGKIRPDLTFLIDCPVEVGLERAWSRIKKGKAAKKEDRFEKEAVDFHKKVRNGFLALAKKEPRRIKVINGDDEIPAIHKRICDIMEREIRLRRR